MPTSYIISTLPEGHRIEMGIRMADALDEVALLIDEYTMHRIEPLIIRLRTRTLGRVGYRRLVGIMAENCLRMGQVEEHAEVLRRIHAQWRTCPLRYIPWPLWTLQRVPGEPENLFS